jgi:hypothetical protein
LYLDANTDWQENRRRFGVGNLGNSPSVGHSRLAASPEALRPCEKDYRDARKSGTDQEALDAFRMLLLAENQLSEDRVRVKLRVVLEEKSRKLAGL